MILEKNNLQTAQEWTKSYIELIASYVHPKTGNHLRSHLRAIMALDHCRLIRPGKKKSGRIFCFRQVYFTKSCQQICVRVKLIFYTIYTSHLRWNSTMRHWFYHTDLEQKAVFHNFAIQITLIQYSGRSKHALKNFQNHLYGQPVLTFAVWAVVECVNEH